jgi:hypothetical protein
MRINFHWHEELERILVDAAAPPYDVVELRTAIRSFETTEEPYAMLRPVEDEPWLQELIVVARSGHTD